jgi:translocation and assembly module TamA
VRFGRETRYLNDRGHRFQTTLLIAERATEAQARYIIPLADPWRERLEIDTRLTEEEIGGGETRQFELGTARITNSGGWQRRLSLTYQRSRDEIGGDVATRNLVLPGIALSRGRFDDPVYTTRGYSRSGKLTGGASSLGSDVSFSRLRLQGSGLRRLWPDARIIGRVELGRVWVDEFSQLPLSQRFYAGGDSSVRGFAYQSLGPEDAQGRVIGGRYLGVASLELEQLVWGDWGAAVFVDHGNAVAEIGDDLRTGAGVGLRYRSPVGVVRVDVAKAVDGDESPRLHLSLGVNF